MTSRGAAGRATAAAALVFVLTSCASLPDRGSVAVEQPSAATTSAAPFDFDPPGPQPEASPDQVVAGFLRALQAAPAGTSGAAAFLTTAAADRWRPDRRTVVYDGIRTRPTPQGVRVLFDGAFTLDAHGRWLGRTGSAVQPYAVPFRLEREGGEWRIADPPNAILIPRSHFATRYRAFSLYFFDPTGSVLVPEPVYLPWGPQAPTALVNGLLAGPTRGERGSVRSFLPRGARLQVSVPVGADGVADVPLSAGLDDLDDPSLQRLLAQFAWTLRQVAEVRSLRLLVDGAPVDLAGGRSTIAVAGWQEFDPAVAAASTDLFGLRGRTVRQIVGEQDLAAAALAGTGVSRPRSLGVSLTGRRFALVSADGRRVVVLTRMPGTRLVTEHAGTDLLRPLWDRTDRLWLLDRGAAGLRVRTLGPGGNRTLSVPGLGRRTPTAGALSRDGSRLALLVPRGGRGGAVVLLSHVERSAEGAPLRLTRVRRVATLGSDRPPVTVGWRDPTTLAVLTRPTPATSEVVLASVDGASGTLGLEPATDLLYAAGVAMAASPGGPLTLLVATDTGRLHELDVTGRWDLDSVPVRLRLPTFAG